MVRHRRRPQTWQEKYNVHFDWHWRSLAAVVYLIICLNDFVVMPVYREFAYQRMDEVQMVKAAQTMKDSTAQVEALKILKEDRPWTPLTNDMFHIAFGAILGVSALPQNRRNNQTGNDPDEGDDDNGGPSPFYPYPYPYHPYNGPVHQPPAPPYQPPAPAPAPAPTPPPAPVKPAPSPAGPFVPGQQTQVQPQPTNPIQQNYAPPPSDTTNGPSVNDPKGTFVPSASPTSSDSQPDDGNDDSNDGGDDNGKGQ